MFAAEVARLRSAGYTYEAIREALASAGVVLTESTLRREMHREDRRKMHPLHAPPNRPQLTPRTDLPEHANSGVPATFALPPCPATPAKSKGHDIAEAFFDTHHSNPLLRPKKPPKDPP